MIIIRRSEKKESGRKINMIQQWEKNFRLVTARTDYLFRITTFGHLEHLYYGPILMDEDLKLSDSMIETLAHKHQVPIGSSVNYSKQDDTYSLDHLCLEWSGIGRGDYRNSPLELKLPDGTFANDFIVESFEIKKGMHLSNSLPTAYGGESDCETLVITMKEVSNNLRLDLIYTVFPMSDVITRRVILFNQGEESAWIRRAYSMSMDLPDRGYQLHTFDGGWIKETHHHINPVANGIHLNCSTTGGSSNRHNPGFLLSESGAGQDQGWVYGFNLIYSGNHAGVVERTAEDLLRVQIGIHDHCFEWELLPGEQFETPEAVLTFSKKGFNGASQQFHYFIQNHIIRGNWRTKERPVKVNSWEGFFFDFNQHQLLQLAKQAKELGVELFVLDDGWFGKRNDDKAGLGDYQVNSKKLPHGLAHLSNQLNQMGMQFGLWFEPEMVNEDSDLYRSHPEYAVKIPGKEPTLGRNQLVLDLCQKEVQDYIIREVSAILDQCNVTYVKWDMNRHMSECYSSVLKNQGEFYHRYMMGLYRVLGEIFWNRPDILLESCSSGGNRFDLGMLCYSQQIWASDDTDPIERLKIQQGLSYLYPQSTFGAHVSSAPHQQTLRDTPLSTRFNVAAFGVLGYELEFKHLSNVEKKEVKDQIAFYKRNRKLLQYGKFSRIDTGKENKFQWQVTKDDRSQAITGFYQTLSMAAESNDVLKVTGLDTNAIYQIKVRSQSLYIKRFGGLVKHLLPVKLKPEGLVLRTANKVYCMKEGTEEFEGTGECLRGGVSLNNQYLGTGYQDKLRLFGDFGSNLYVTTKMEE